MAGVEINLFFLLLIRFVLVAGVSVLYGWDLACGEILSLCHAQVLVCFMCWVLSALCAGFSPWHPEPLAHR